MDNSSKETMAIPSTAPDRLTTQTAPQQTVDYYALITRHFDACAAEPSILLSSILPPSSLDAKPPTVTLTEQPPTQRRRRLAADDKPLKAAVKSGKRRENGIAPEPRGAEGAEGEATSLTRTAPRSRGAGSVKRNAGFPQGTVPVPVPFLESHGGKGPVPSQQHHGGGKQTWPNPEYRRKKLRGLYREMLWSIEEFLETHPIKGIDGIPLTGIGNPYRNIRFFTLTVPHGRRHGDSIVRLIQEAWRAFQNALHQKVKRDGGRLECVKFVGLHADGLNPHLHVIVISDIEIDRGWMLKEWVLLTKASPTALDFSETFNSFRDLRQVVWYCCQNLDYECGPTKKRITRTKWFTSRKPFQEQEQIDPDIVEKLEVLRRLCERHFNKPPPEGRTADLAGDQGGSTRAGNIPTGGKLEGDGRRLGQKPTKISRRDGSLGVYWIASKEETCTHGETVLRHGGRTGLCIFPWSLPGSFPRLRS